MEFKVNSPDNIPRGYSDQEIKDAQAITNSLVTRCGRIVKSVLLNRPPISQKSNLLPFTVLIDDIDLSQQKVDEYIEQLKLVTKNSKKKVSFVTTKLSNHWVNVRDKNQDYLKFLLDNITMYDVGFVLPVKHLITNGKIRPSKEASWLYFVRSQTTLKRVRQHILQATIDLYWAAIDAAHAAIMDSGAMPPKPADVAITLQQRFPNLDKASINTITDIHDIAKKILHGRLDDIKGSEYQSRRLAVEKFIAKMNTLVKS